MRSILGWLMILRWGVREEVPLPFRPFFAGSKVLYSLWNIWYEMHAAERMIENWIYQKTFLTIFWNRHEISLAKKTLRKPMLPLLNDRASLAGLIPQNGKAAELGVAKGHYSYELLSLHKTVTLWSIDRWSDHHDDRERAEAERILFKFGNRSKIITATFEDAVKLFPDDHFDFLYFDGYAHTGQDSGKTLELYWPKLKKGGIISGHDFHPDYQPTIDEVTKFASKHKLSFNLTRAATWGPDRFPSWYAKKE